MKKLLVAIILLISFNVQAQYITQTGAGYQFKRTKSDSTILIPTFCGVPTLRGSTVTKQSAIAFDSCNNRLYYYNPKTFVWDIQNPKDTFYILATGQSNSAGRGYTAQADTARDSRVQGWDSVSKAWVTLTVGYSPFYETFVTTATPSPSAQFYFARKLARLRNCIVRVVNFASAGNDVTTITAWHDGVTPQLFLKKIDTLSLQSKVKNYDIVIWDQGESDAAMLDSTYKASFDSIKSYIRKQGYVLPTTPIIVVGMPSLYQNANPFYIHKDSLFRTFDYNNDAYDGYASTDSIPLRSDNLHYNSAGLQRLGENSIWTAWQSLPTNFSSTTFQAKNGLSYKNNAVEIGGILNKNTTIDLGINQLWLKTPTKTNDDSTITGQVIIGDNNFIRKTIFFNNNNPALLINKNKSNNNENVSLLSMTTADVNTKNGWLFQNYSNLSGVVIPNLRTYSPSFDNSYIHDVYTKDNAINGGVTIRVRNYDSLNFSNKVNNEVVNTKLLNIQNGQSLKLAVNSEGKTIIGNGINSIIPTSQLQVVGTGIFTDTLTITTMQNGDSSNRAASTAFVKRNGGAGGGATPIDTSFLRRDINTNTAQIIANAAAIQQRYDSLRRLPGSTQVQGLKSGIWYNAFIDSVGVGGGGGGNTYTGTAPVVVTGSVISIDTTKAQGKLATFNDVDIAKRWGLSGADIYNLNSGDVGIGTLPRYAGYFDVNKSFNVQGASAGRYLRYIESLGKLVISNNTFDDAIQIYKQNTGISNYLKMEDGNSGGYIVFGSNGSNFTPFISMTAGDSPNDFGGIAITTKDVSTTAAFTIEARKTTGALTSQPLMAVNSFGSEKFTVLANGNIKIPILSTSLTAPLTTGTTRMAIVDQFGMFSSLPLPTGGGAATFQQSLDNGNTTNRNDSIIVGSNNFQIYAPNTSGAGIIKIQNGLGANGSPGTTIYQSRSQLLLKSINNSQLGNPYKASSLSLDSNVLSMIYRSPRNETNYEVTDSLLLSNGSLLGDGVQTVFKLKTNRASIRRVGAGFDNIDKVIITSVNGTQADSTGNVTIPKSYKVYTALLTQTGTTAPIATELENTIGTAVWTRSSAGDYLLTFPSGVTNTAKIWLTPSMSSTSSRDRYAVQSGGVLIHPFFKFFTNNVFELAYPADDQISNLPIEIRVYN